MKSFHKRGGVSPFSYSYSDFIYPIIYELIYGKNLNKDFTNTTRGGGHHFVKVFHKIPVFFKGWLPLGEASFKKN